MVHGRHPLTHRLPCSLYAGRSNRESTPCSGTLSLSSSSTCSGAHMLGFMHHAVACLVAGQLLRVGGRHAEWAPPPTDHSPTETQPTSLKGAMYRAATLILYPSCLPCGLASPALCNGT